MNRLVAALLVVPASFVATSLARGPAFHVEGKPDFAKKENKDCSYCHKNPKGAGPLNDKGTEYRKNGLKFPVEAKGFGEDGAFSSEANAKAWELAKKAIELGHWSDALKRIGELKAKEKKGPAAQFLLNQERAVDNRGLDLARTARDAVQGGKVPEAAEALIRVETEFKGREAAKDIGKIRAEFGKLAGSKEADAAAKAVEPQRLAWFDAQMREAEGKKPDALRIATELCTKYPSGPFTDDARKKIVELGGKPPAPPAADSAPAGMGA
jgi:hypothetical protein